MSEVPVIIRDRYYVPARYVDQALLRELYEVPLETKEMCRPGCHLANKPGRYCSTCPSLDARVRMWEIVETSKTRFVALPCGDSKPLRALLKGRQIRFIDKRTRVPFRSKLEWRGRLRRKGDVDGQGRPLADQLGMIRKWRDHVNSGETGGLVVSPPRSGKCVAGDTLIHTDRGFVRIDSLFENYPHDIEVIGRFGYVATPYGIREIRGLYSQVVDQTIEVMLSSGVKLRGSPVHPIMIVNEMGFVEWCELQHLQGHETVVLPADCRFGKKAYDRDVYAAVLFGSILARADRKLLPAGLASIYVGDVPFEHSIRRSIYSLTRCITSRDNLVVDRARVPWEAHEAGWWVPRDFACMDWYSLWNVVKTIVGVDATTGTLVFTVPTVVARVLHAHLTGSGVRVVMENYGSETALIVPTSVELLCYLNKGKRQPSVGARSSALLEAPHEYSFDSILTIRRINERERVYDIMVPGTHCFNTNGIASHNTVIGVAATTLHKERTLITASEINWLRQFGKRFGENTNARDLYSRGKRPVVIVDPKGWPEAAKYGVLAVKKWGKETDAADVVMSTYQQLIDVDTRLEKWKTHVANRFGKLIGDEIDQAAAKAFSRVINRTNVRYRLGLTATVHRKDKLEKCVNTILGPVVIKGKAVSTLPNLELLETGVNCHRTMKTWNGIVNFLSNSEERNKIIVRKVFADLRSNKKARVLIPAIRVAHVQTLVKMINQQASYNRQNRGENWPKELAVAYFGKTNTNLVLNQINAGQVRVTVSNVRMVQRGLDVPRWTHVYVGVIPTSNPMIVWQLINRVCTPYPEELEKKIGPKPQPTVRILIDPMSASVFCFKRIFEDKNYGLMAGIQGTNFIETKSYKASPEQLARMYSIAKYPKSYDPSDAGVKHVLGVTKYGKKRKKQTWQAKRPITKF